jgi:hypothetical protein
MRNNSEFHRSVLTLRSTKQFRFRLFVQQLTSCFCYRRPASVESVMRVCCHNVSWSLLLSWHANSTACLFLGRGFPSNASCLFSCLFLIFHCQSGKHLLKQGNGARLRQPRSDDQITDANMVRACTSWVPFDQTTPYCH